MDCKEKRMYAYIQMHGWMNGWKWMNGRKDTQIEIGSVHRSQFELWMPSIA